MNTRVFVCLLLGIQLMLTVVRAATPTPGDTTAGKVTYARLCVGCHGLDGQGGRMQDMLPVPPRNLADRTYMDTRSDQQLFEVIRRGGAAVGLSSSMRAFGDQLTDQQLWDTVAYIRTLTAQSNAPADAPKAVAPGAEISRLDLHMVRLRLSIWPEYDDPRVLVMFRGEMAPRDAFPTRITLPVPQGAEIIGAGLISEQNELVLHPHQILPGDTSNNLELNLPTPRFFVEFYYTPFTMRADKHFTYVIPTPYPIERLEVDIQQPLHATNFTTDPQPMRQRTDEQGLTYHLFAYHNVGKSERRSFTVSYTKTVAQPSVAKRPPEPDGMSQPRTPGHDMIMALALLVGTTALFGGSTWLWAGYQQRRKTVLAPSLPSPQAVAQPNTEKSSLSTPSPHASDTPNFCSHCGSKLQSEYHFCPGCGRPLRRDA